MAGKKGPAVEPEEPSRTAGACVLLVLAGVVTAVVFAISPTAGVLAVWVLGAVLLWRAAGRMSDSSATPPAPLSGDVYAGHGDEIERVQEGPGEGLTILYPVRREEVDET
ncbi:hypothetical protein ACFY3G_14910 [Streptomyces phaeochromogenes]|uniref:hypothetical protein n=1 Tax=Streptomyces phaeochromogenes TaxID=1923 RepID=UPI0036974D7E